jgi:hypothetical protein
MALSRRFSSRSTASLTKLCWRPEFKAGLKTFKVNQMSGRGGKRPGAGRKKGGANRKSREVADAVAVTGETPLAYMMSVLRDQNAEQARRDEMAKSAAPYVHPRLGMTATINPPSAGERINNITIISVPRGAQFCPESGLIRYDDGLECSPPVFTPFRPSPGIDEQPAPPAPVEPAPVVEPLPVIEPVGDPTKLAYLDVHRSRIKRSGDDGTPAPGA